MRESAPHRRRWLEHRIANTPNRATAPQEPSRDDRTREGEHTREGRSPAPAAAQTTQPAPARKESRASETREKPEDLLARAAQGRLTTEQYRSLPPHKRAIIPPTQIPRGAFGVSLSDSMARAIDAARQEHDAIGRRRKMEPPIAEVGR